EATGSDETGFSSTKIRTERNPVILDKSPVLCYILSSNIEKNRSFDRLRTGLENGILWPRNWP
ncbi:MAG: hypothetical protein ABIK13_04885, partial [Patescibacteria group bacterium]